jgi:hypothetical protein
MQGAQYDRLPVQETMTTDEEHGTEDTECEDTFGDCEYSGAHIPSMT